MSFSCCYFFSLKSSLMFFFSTLCISMFLSWKIPLCPFGLAVIFHKGEIKENLCHYKWKLSNFYCFIEYFRWVMYIVRYILDKHELRTKLWPTDGRVSVLLCGGRKCVPSENVNILIFHRFRCVMYRLCVDTVCRYEYEDHGGSHTS